MKTSRRDTDIMACADGSSVGARVVSMARLAAAMHMAEVRNRTGADTVSSDEHEIRWREAAERIATREARA